MQIFYILGRLKEEDLKTKGPSRDRDLPLREDILPVAGERAGQAVQETEKRYILQALRITNSNKTQAARILGIALNTLKAKMRSYGIDGAINI